MAYEYKVEWRLDSAGGTMTLMVGNTYTITLDGFTATQGYNQLESFINFPNTIFQILSVSTTYSADSNITNVPTPTTTLPDACIWDNDPGSPNYRSCTGGDDKAGGTVSVIYGQDIAGRHQPDLGSLFTTSPAAVITTTLTLGSPLALQILSVPSVTIQKTFAPKAISPAALPSSFVDQPDDGNFF